MGCASSIHISDRVVYSGKESEESHSPQQTNTTQQSQQQGNPAQGLPIKPSNFKVRQIHAASTGEGGVNPFLFLSSLKFAHSKYLIVIDHLQPYFVAYPNIRIPWNLSILL